MLATALFDRPAFETCVTHGIVLGSDGQKMSKSLRNYPDPMEVFDQHGADAMRWYLLSSPILRGNDFSVTATGLRDTARQVLLPLWNAWYFLALYANVAGHQGVARPPAEASAHVLDRYVLAKTRQLVAEMTAAMDAYDLYGACARVRAFVEVLTNWYIRRSRQRFWDGDHDAIDTLHTVLDVVVRVAAPLLPYVAEEIHGGLHQGRRRGKQRSVHLRDWPRPDELPADDELVEAMDEVRDVCSATLSVRKAHGRRVRQPLATLTIADSRRRAPGPVRRDHRRRGQRPRRHAHRRRRRGRRPRAAGRAGHDRAAARQAHPGRHPRRQGRRLAPRGRSRRRRRALAGARRVHPDDGRRR